MQYHIALECQKDISVDHFDSMMLRGTECPRMKSRTGMPMAKALAQASREGYRRASARSLPNEVLSTRQLG